MSKRKDIVFAEGLNIGDKVRKRNGMSFANGEKVVTIERFTESPLSQVGILAWFSESHTNLGVEEIELAHKNNQINEIVRKREEHLKKVDEMKKDLEKAIQFGKDLDTTIKTLKELNDIE